MRDACKEFAQFAGCTEDAREIDVVAPEEVRRFVAARGGSLYVWVSTHGCCTGRVALLETATQPPPRPDMEFRRAGAAGFDLYLDAGRRVWPRTLELALAGRGRRVSAYWNGQAWVG